MRTLFLLLFVAGSTVALAQKGGAAEEVNAPAEKKGLIDKSKGFTSLLAGVALADDQPGFYAEFAKVYKPGSFGFGVFTSFVRVPKLDYAAWTIVGLQLRAGPATGNAKPYFVFDYGMINMAIVGDDVNMRTADLDLGGGIEIPAGGDTFFLVDAKWKRFLDYKAERDPYTIWTINVGLRF